jgi:hypothetical protein
MSGQDLPGGARLIAVPNNEGERGNLLAMEAGLTIRLRPTVIRSSSNMGQPANDR